MSTRLEHRNVSRRAVAALVVMIGAIGFAVVGVPSFGQEKMQTPTEQPEPPKAKHDVPEATDCRDCHTCDKPTAEDPCLRPCGRSREAEAIEALSHGDVPQGVILLDMLSDVKDVKDHFGPVPFDHSGHARWAEIAGGCVICHHYTPEGVAHPACRSCHEVSFRHQDMRKPGLKGAYHRQCLGCHLEWSHETACDVCHLSRVGGEGQGRTGATVTKDDVMGKIHPPIPEPEVEIYQTKYRGRPGAKAIFRHKEHTQHFGFKCAECHRGDSCLRCHEEGKQHKQHVRTLEEHHNPCAHCHDMESPEGCGHCHWEEGKPQPPPFDHATTGWPLGRHHEDKSCRVCHKNVRFVKLDRDCNKCHEAWAPDNFDHRVTGQALDENHAETDCEECHIDRKFDQPPTCDECHDEDEGIAFPDRRPGPVVNVKQKTVGGSMPSDKTPPKAPGAVGQEKSGAAPPK